MDEKLEDVVLWVLSKVSIHRYRYNAWRDGSRDRYKKDTEK